MTYKKSSEFQMFHNRTGSHTTAPLQTGDAVTLPYGADPNRQIFLGIMEQWKLLVSQIQEIEDKILEINAATRTTLPYSEFLYFKNQKEALGHKKQALQDASIQLRKLTNDASRNAFGIVWRGVAEKMLTTDQFNAIEAQVKGMVDFNPGHILRMPMDERDRASQEKLKDKRRISEKRSRSRKTRARLGIGIDAAPDYMIVHKEF